MKGDAMLPRISVRNAKVSEATRDHIARACDKLTQFCDDIVDCEVMVAKSKLGTSVEIVVKIPQHTLTSSACAENLFKALAEAREQMEGQLRKQHDKTLTHG